LDIVKSASLWDQAARGVVVVVERGPALTRSGKGARDEGWHFVGVRGGEKFSKVSLPAFLKTKHRG